MNYEVRNFRSGKLPRRWFTLKEIAQAIIIAGLLSSPAWLGIWLDLL